MPTWRTNLQACRTSQRPGKGRAKSRSKCETRFVNSRRSRGSGVYRVHRALLRIGIEVSPAPCGRIMAANRQLYGVEKPQRQPRAKLEMPFKAERRHQYWSADIRYIEEHLLPDPKPVYVITIFENFSRMVLSSAISATQTQWDFLSVLANAIHRYEPPEALVTHARAHFYPTL